MWPAAKLRCSKRYVQFLSVFPEINPTHHSYHFLSSLSNGFRQKFQPFGLLSRLFSSNNFHVSVCKLHAFACCVNLWLEGFQWVFGIGIFLIWRPEFRILTEANWARLRIKRMQGCGMRDVKNSHRDSGMEKIIWVRMTGWKNPITPKNRVFTWPSQLWRVIYKVAAMLMYQQ